MGVRNCSLSSEGISSIPYLHVSMFEYLLDHTPFIHHRLPPRDQQQPLPYRRSGS